MYAAIYPGQGSQHVGMGEFLYKEFAPVRHRFEEASDAVGVDFKKLLFEGSETDLALTENTQPAILLVSTASYDVLYQVADFQPAVTSGHSIGEYASFVTSGALNFSDAIGLVRNRGQFMQEAVKEGVGGMLATLGFSPLQVETICSWCHENNPELVLEPANFNAPGQIVISGHQKAIDWVIENYNEEVLSKLPEEQQKVRRSKFIPLKVSAPFHCSLMKPAEDKMRQLIEKTEFSNSNFPIIQNYTAEATEDINQSKESLIRQVSAPVRWIECVENFKNYQVEKAVEVGAGTVLKGLLKKIDTNIQVLNLNSMDDLKAIEQELK